MCFLLLNFTFKNEKMKKFKALSGILALSLFAFTSCSDDDNNDNGDNSNQIAGTYRLTEVNTSGETDFNEDGTSNTNQMLESDCYNDSRIVLNADGTLTYYNNYILVNTQNGDATCSSMQADGTWELDSQVGTTMIIDATYLDGNNNQVNVSLTKQGNRLSHYTLFGMYPNRSDSGGAILTPGSITHVFERE